MAINAQSPPPGPIEPGVSLELAKWRAARYSDVRYKLNLTLEKMSPVLKGSIEIRVKVGAADGAATLLSPSPLGGEIPPIILDWRKISGHEEKSAISNVTVNGEAVSLRGSDAGEGARVPVEEHNEHLIFREGVKLGENVIKLDFTSPILTSGSAITRYVDKEDGAEYIYSLFVPSDASTAFPVFDQPDLKARFTLSITTPVDWKVTSNDQFYFLNSNYDYGPEAIEQVKTSNKKRFEENKARGSKTFSDELFDLSQKIPERGHRIYYFRETQPISTYVFAFAAGPWVRFAERNNFFDSEDFLDLPINCNSRSSNILNGKPCPPMKPSGVQSVGDGVYTRTESYINVRKSQAAKFRPHAAEVFRLNREGIKFLETYFDYKFPFPKYDLVLIPEFPFGGMEHAGATFLREASIIFPQEPTKNDLVSRATLIFHEAAHQWFGDTVTMKWFDDLWLKEGFANFMAYKATERVMPEMNPWKVFYERVKQAAYQTDSTKGTTPIYQEIKNLSAAKSAYGNIVYNKAPAFLRQAEFYLGEDKFKIAVRSFLKKHEYANASWEDLVKEFETASGRDLKEWASGWVKTRGGPRIKSRIQTYRMREGDEHAVAYEQYSSPFTGWYFKTVVYWLDEDLKGHEFVVDSKTAGSAYAPERSKTPLVFVFPNYKDYGYGIFLLDEKSRDYVLKNVQNEKDPFLRSMMWGALWDSVREGELDPREYVGLAIKNLPSEQDESIAASILGRTGTAMNYYLLESPAVAGASDLRTRLENMLIERIGIAETLGQRITYYRAFLNIAASDEARDVLRTMLAIHSRPRGLGNSIGISGLMTNKDAERIFRFEQAIRKLPLKTKDKFDIVTRLLILNDPDAPKLLADLEKTETSDDAKRYAYAARAGIATVENKAKYWNDFVNNKEISESWIEAAFGPWNSIRHSELTLPYLQRALQELPNHKRNRKIFFVNGWLGAFIGGQRSEEALAIVNKFLADNSNLDNDLKLKILENVDLIERAVRIRAKYGH